MIPLYIFDLDGTLANMQHRVNLIPSVGLGITPEDRAAQWDRFFQACEFDRPIWPVIHTFHDLLRAGADILIWSGRSDSVRRQTVRWLVEEVLWTCSNPLVEGYIRTLDDQLRMRPMKDHRPDHQLKELWLNELSPEDRKRLVAVFDDRDEVVAMWRRNGVICFQVAEGSF